MALDKDVKLKMLKTKIEHMKKKAEELKQCVDNNDGKENQVSSLFVLTSNGSYKIANAVKPTFTNKTLKQYSFCQEERTIKYAHAPNAIKRTKRIVNKILQFSEKDDTYYSSLEYELILGADFSQTYTYELKALLSCANEKELELLFKYGFDFDVLYQNCGYGRYYNPINKDVARKLIKYIENPFLHGNTAIPIFFCLENEDQKKLLSARSFCPPEEVINHVISEKVCDVWEIDMQNIYNAVELLFEFGEITLTGEQLESILKKADEGSCKLLKELKNQINNKVEFRQVETPTKSISVCDKVDDVAEQEMDKIYNQAMANIEHER